ncbi:hypothetical protein C2E23DRAFT_887703 [Lenzites betulinus]|nr:hypothetical protein C2E23DRAFT_887703 [Lenzites betulinus]
MGNIRHTVDECALNTALTAQTFAHAKHPKWPLKKLRKIHLTPLENVIDTLTKLLDSPVESLSVQRHEDDVVNMCSALEDFLSLRGVRRARLLPAPARDQGRALAGEGADAVRRLKEYCRDLRLQGAADTGAAAKERRKRRTS